MSLFHLFLGRRLATSEEKEQKIGVWTGVPTLGLDALGSASYGPEAALTILIPLGAAGLAYVEGVSVVILGLLAVLYFSYRQTLAAYPNGGGSYTVARENLGTRAGLLAAASLMLDYVLNVAVGISAGVGALVSAVPSLQPHILALCLVILGLITLVNLRGARESGVLFSVPTYLFVLSLLGTLGFGIFKVVTGGGHLLPAVPPPPLAKGTEPVGLWLLLRAFASGCTAMTGVEAVSNGIAAFEEPKVDRARHTLTFIVVVLALLLGGIAFLAHAYHVGAMDQEKPGYQSVISQLVAAVVGRGVIYYVTIGSVLAVLALSANTSFSGFPRLCRIVAEDGYLPRVLSQVGHRLVYSAGILVLAGTAGLLLAGFGGITDRLIPLFAVGAFGAFTLSQAGMVMHWRRAGGRGARTSLAINALGVATTGTALVVIIIAKFTEGAWVTLVLIPAALAVFYWVKRHYLLVARQTHSTRPLNPHQLEAPLVVVPIKGWNRLTEEALRFGMRLSPDVVAVRVTTGQEEDKAETDDPHPRWQTDVEEPARAAGLNPPRLEVLDSPYRLLLQPLLEYIQRLKSEQAAGRWLAVIVPELYQTRWYESFLHNDRAKGLRAAILALKDPGIVVINVPWYLDEQRRNVALLEGSRPTMMSGK